jgi:hypothetical protein
MDQVTMDEKTALAIFEKSKISHVTDEILFDVSKSVYFENDKDYIILDGQFDVDELDAIVWWMRNKKVTT